MPVPALPFELTDQIIDALDGDIPSLKSCALTCRSWTPRCNAWLHNDIRLHLNEEDTLQPLMQRYESLPLRNYVRRLTIYVTMSTGNAIPLEKLSDILHRACEHFSNVADITILALSEGISIHQLVRSVPRATIDVPYPQDINLTVRTLHPTINFDSPVPFYHLLQAHAKLSRLAICGRTRFSDEHNWFSELDFSSRDVLPSLRTAVLTRFATPEDRDIFLLWLFQGREGSSLSSVSLSGTCTAGMNQALAYLGRSLEYFKFDDRMELERASSLSLSCVFVQMNSHYVSFADSAPA